MAAVPANERAKAFVGRADGYPFGTFQLWVGAAVLMFVLSVNESILREDGEQADDLLPWALGATAPVAFVNRWPRVAAVICVLSIIVQQSDSNNPPLVSCVVALALVLCAAAYHVHVAFSVCLVVPFLYNAVSPFNGDDPGAPAASSSS